MTIEVLQCKHCHQLSLSVDNHRLPNIGGPKAHKGPKCRGQWSVLATAEVSGQQYKEIRQVNRSIQNIRDWAENSALDQHLDELRKRGNGVDY